MRLGNSNGNNKGKKYFLRKSCTGMQPIDENKEIANIFGSWFAENMDSLINFLKMKMYFDEDVFNTTFMRMYEKILFTGMEVKDNKAYFFRSYYTNYIQERTYEKRYGDPLPYDNRSESSRDAKEIEYSQIMLESDIFNYVYLNYSDRDFRLFKMYMTLVPKITFQALAEMENVKAYTIQRIISKITQDVRSNKQFLERYYDITA